MSKFLNLNNEGGCSAKLNSGYLSEILASLNLKTKSNRLITDMTYGEDACAYQLTDELAVINTVDFFGPMVENPYVFGQIAAANALSDIYAMGGEPILALNLLSFPTKEYGKNVICDILAGGLSIIESAGAALGGGHTIESPCLSYGLSVTGLVRPDTIWTMTQASLSDCLVLTKAIGTGIGNIAIKSNLLTSNAKDIIIKSQTTLNNATKNIAIKYGIKAATDISGFGLIGHLGNLAKASNLTLRINCDKVDFFPQIAELAKEGILPGGCHRNRKALSDIVRFDPNIPLFIQDLLFDPQTSGGLALVVNKNLARDLVNELRQNDIIANEIGQFNEFKDYWLEVT